MASVEIVTPDGSQLVELRSSAVTFGRLASNDVALPYSHISRQHAEAQLRQGVWWIVDLGSTNGLHVNGQRVQEARLDSNVIVELSPQVSLRMTAAPAPAEPAPWAITPPLADPAVTPLSAYGARSPYADDEAPYYPNMRPPTRESQPRPPQAPRAPAIPETRLTARSQFNTDPLPLGSVPPRGARPDPLDGIDLEASESQRRADEIIRRRRATAAPPPQDEIIRRRSATAGPASTLLHLCQTCGQRTAPDALYCQNCHHSIASECSHCRLNLLPVQDICPRCQAPNPASVHHSARPRH